MIIWSDSTTQAVSRTRASRVGPGAPVTGVRAVTTDVKGGTLLSDEPTIELVLRARQGDRNAVEALLQRCLPSVRRWAHGRLPAGARAYLDTEDIVQEAALHTVRRLDVFQPQHVGAMQRTSVNPSSTGFATRCAASGASRRLLSCRKISPATRHRRSSSRYGPKRTNVTERL